MPNRETLNIEKFSAGMISNADTKDVPADAPVYSMNTDPDAVAGKLQNIRQPLQSTKHNGKADKARNNEFIQRETGERDLVYFNGSAIRAMPDFDGVAPGAEVVVGSSATKGAITIQNQAAHVGCGNDDVPRWAGYIGHTIFGGIGQVSAAGGLFFPDCYVGGHFTGTANLNYRVEIDSNGASDTFKWSDDGGATWDATLVTITGNRQNLNNGVEVNFYQTTGYTIGTYLTFTVYAYPTNMQIYDAELIAQETAGTTIGKFKLFNFWAHAAVGGFFLTTRLYRWKFSLLYDGYEESPLSDAYLEDTPGSDSDFYNIRIIAYGATSSQNSFNRRVTAVRIYRADSTDTDPANLGFYRLVKELGINDVTANYTYTSASSSGNLDTWGVNVFQPNSPNRQAEIEDDGRVRASYEASTGITETLENTMVNYGLSEVVNSQLFIGDCSHDELPDAQFYLFRSKPYRYDTFDWTTDLLRLPYVPKAMSSFAGRLFVFCENLIYKINPDGFFVEDIWYNITTINDRSVITIATGMYWCDMDNIYWYDGKTVRPIGDSIKTTDYSGGMSWQDFIANNIGDYNASVFVQYYERKNIVLFIASRTITGTHAFTYHLTRQKWDYPKLLSTATATGTILTLDGVLFLARNSVTDSVYEAFANTDYYDLEWVSSELPKLEMAQLKKFYNLVAEGTNLTVTYSIDGGSTWRSLTSGTEVKDVSGDWEHQKTIMIQLASSNSSFAGCENLELIFRRMRGKR